MRRFKEGAYNHVYQRTVNGFNIFYSVFDYLVYYTIFSTVAYDMGVSVLALCFMVDHIHMLVRTGDLKTLRTFMSVVSSMFVKEYNNNVGRRGHLFRKPFGSAPKSDRKKLISSIIYIGNNPVEKHLSLKPEQYRWNVLAYVVSDNPFSDKIVLSKSSPKLRAALKIVKWNHSQRRYLNYALLTGISAGLTPVELNQLVDYIISIYNPIDKERLMKIFGTYDNMLKAMHSTTGSEYDLQEDYEKSPDTVYRDMIRYVRKHVTSDVRSVTVYTEEKKLELAVQMKIFLSVQMWQLAKFLHLERV